MRGVILLLLGIWTFLLTSDSHAQNSSESPRANIFSKSTRVGEYYLVLAGQKTLTAGKPEAAHIDDEILFKIVKVTDGPVIVFRPRDLESFCKIDLLDEHENPIMKLRSAVSIGSKFGKSEEFSPRKSTGLVAMPLRSVNEFDMGGSGVLPAPSKLFRIEKPGIYNVRLSIRISVPTDGKRKIIELGPVSLPFTNLEGERQKGRPLGRMSTSKKVFVPNLFF